MRARQCILSFAGILSLSILFSGFLVGTALCDEQKIETKWTQKHIAQVPPIMMNEPFFLNLFGQTDRRVPYTYEEAVKLAGHSCGATAGAWEITRKALKVLYPCPQIPVRGEIRVYAPGSESQWNVGVFGEIITYITGAAPHTGFNGAEFTLENPVYKRQDLLIYTPLPRPTPPPQMEWIFERLNTLTGEVIKRVGVKYNLTLIQPPATADRTAMGRKMARGEATHQEAADYIKYWNDRVVFVFANADTLPGFFTVTEY